jgi:hypothetical protein
MLEAGQHQADAGAGFVMLDQGNQGRLKRRLRALHEHKMQLGQAVPQIRMSVSSWGKDKFGNRVRFICAIDD